jgi:hypothetical protein
MEGQLGRDLLRPERAGILPFVQQFDSTDSDPVVIEVEFLGFIDGVADFDALADVGGGDFVEGALEADGRIVIDDPFVAEEEDLIQLGFGEPMDGYSAGGGVVAVDGPLADAGVDFMVIIILEPQREGLVEFLQGEGFL